MKKLSLLLLLLTSLSWAQSPITITGTITDSSNNVATSGYIQFSLTPNNQGLAYVVPPSTTIASISRCQINASGQPVNYITGVGACLVWPNDLILPANTLYQIQIAPNSQVSRVYNNVLLASSTDPQPLATLRFISPQPVVGTVINGSPLVTMSVVPSTDLVYVLGQSNKRYITGYFNTLNVPTINATNITVTGTCTGCSSSVTDWPNPGTIGSTTPNTGKFTTLQSTGLATLASLQVTGNSDLTGNFLLHGISGIRSPLNLYSNAPFTEGVSIDAPVGGLFVHQAPAASGTYMVGFTAGTGCGTFNTTTGALNLSTCAPLASPALTGNPTAPTQAALNNSTRLATTAYVDSAVSAVSSTIVVSKSGALVTHTGTLTEDTIYSVSLPSGFAVNTQVEVTMGISLTVQDANATTFRIKLNGGAAVGTITSGGAPYESVVRAFINNINSTGSQATYTETQGCPACPIVTIVGSAKLTTGANTLTVTAQNAVTAGNTQLFRFLNVRTYP
jgi:hypothetical protein